MDKGFEVQPEIASSNLIRDCKLLMLLQKKFHRVVIIVFARWYKSSFPLVCWVSFKTLIYMISNISKSFPQISHFYNYGNAVASVTLLSCSSDNNVVAWLSQVAQIRIRKKKEKKKNRIGAYACATNKLTLLQTTMDSRVEYTCIQRVCFLIRGLVAKIGGCRETHQSSLVLYSSDFSNFYTERNFPQNKLYKSVGCNYGMYLFLV